MEGLTLKPAKSFAFLSCLIALGIGLTVARPIPSIPHQTAQPIRFDGTINVIEDKTTSMTSAETYRESKNSHPRVINTKAIEASNHEANTYDPTFFPEFPKVLPDFQGSSDTNMETILENNLRETPSTADEIIAGKIDNLAAKIVKAREIVPEVMELFENVKPEEKVTEAAEMKSHGSVGSNLEKQASSVGRNALDSGNPPPISMELESVKGEKLKDNLVKIREKRREIMKKMLKLVKERKDELVERRNIKLELKKTDTNTMTAKKELQGTAGNNTVKEDETKKKSATYLDLEKTKKTLLEREKRVIEKKRAIMNEREQEEKMKETGHLLREKIENTLLGLLNTLDETKLIRLKNQLDEDGKRLLSLLHF
jgi:hypothetical protein